MRSWFAVADQPAEGALAPLVVGRGPHRPNKPSTILPPRGLFMDSISRAVSKSKLVWRIGGSGVHKSMGKL